LPAVRRPVPRRRPTHRPLRPRDQRRLPGDHRGVRGPVRPLGRPRLRATAGAVAGAHHRRAAGAVTPLQIVAADAVVWAGWSAVVGYSAHRLPRARLDHDNLLTRLRPWEREGRVYERFGIRRW